MANIDRTRFKHANLRALTHGHAHTLTKTGPIAGRHTHTHTHTLEKRCCLVEQMYSQIQLTQDLEFPGYFNNEK